MALSRKAHRPRSIFLQARRVLQKINSTPPEKIDNLPSSLKKFNRFLSPSIGSIQSLARIIPKNSVKELKFLNFIWDREGRFEYIFGKFVSHSPAARFDHSQCAENILVFIHLHIEGKKIGMVYNGQSCCRFGSQCYLMPDICFWHMEKVKNFTPNTFFYPLPDLIVEVLSQQTENYDRIFKKNIYEASKVQEYLIVDPEKEEVEQYVLKKGLYELINKKRF